MSAAPTALPPPALPLLWCPTCDRGAGGTDADWKRYERTGWPKCCGRQMACYTPSMPVVDTSSGWERVGAIESEWEALAC